MTEKTLTKADLEQFTTPGGRLYIHPDVPDVYFSEGVLYVVKRGNARWLLDEIAEALVNPIVTGESFQVWKLTVRKDRSAVLKCETVLGTHIFSKKIERIDFPLRQIYFYVNHQVIKLPREHR
jgi:hypothetical protein